MEKKTKEDYIYIYMRFSKLDAHLLRITYLDIFDILEDVFSFYFVSCRIHLVVQITRKRWGNYTWQTFATETYLVNEIGRFDQVEGRRGQMEICWLPLQYTTNATANVEIEVLQSMFFLGRCVHFDDRSIRASSSVLYRTCCLRKCKNFGLLFSLLVQR